MTTPRTAAGPLTPEEETEAWNFYVHRTINRIDMTSAYTIRGLLRLIDEMRSDRAEARAAALERGYFDGYKAGLVNEVDDWNAPDSLIEGYARDYAIDALRERS